MNKKQKKSHLFTRIPKSHFALNTEIVKLKFNSICETQSHHVYWQLPTLKTVKMKSEKEKFDKNN